MDSSIAYCQIMGLKGDEMIPKCHLCRDVGWVLEGKRYKSDNTLTIELLPCPIPDCEASGRPISLLSVNYAKLDKTSRHPSEKYIMSLGN